MCEFHTKIPTSNRHLQLAAPLAALLCRNSMKRVSQRVFLVKKSEKHLRNWSWIVFVCFTVDEENCGEPAKQQQKGKTEWDISLKGHSQLWDCADLDTTFASLKSVYLNPQSNVPSDTSRNPLQSCKVVHSTLGLSQNTSFWPHFNWSYDIILSYLVKKSIQRNMNRRGENRVGDWREKSPSFTRTTKKMNQ